MPFMDVCKVLEHLRVFIDKIQLLLFIFLICSELVKEKLWPQTIYLEYLDANKMRGKDPLSY